MPALTQPNDGVTLAYETFGDPRDPAVLLIIGFQSSLIGWDEDFCRRIAASGRYVVRYDPRDIGKSTKHDEVVDGQAAIDALYAGLRYAGAAYDLSDLASDCVGLLDGLGIGMAHVVGGSMGGFVAQVLAAEHPERLMTLTLVMTTTLEPHHLPPPEILSLLLAPPAPTREDALAAHLATQPILLGGRFFDTAYATRQFDLLYDYGLFPESSARQIAAVSARHATVDEISAIDLPTLVIHGTADPLIPCSGGQRLAELIPGAHLLLVDGLGHGLAPGVIPLLAGAVAGHTDVTTHP